MTLYLYRLTTPSINLDPAITQPLRTHSLFSTIQPSPHSPRSHNFALAPLLNVNALYRTLATATARSPIQTKKVVLRLECTVCKVKHQLVLKRTKHFELGGDKKQVSLGVFNKIAASVLTSFSEVPPSLSKLTMWIGNGDWFWKLVSMVLVY